MSDVRVAARVDGAAGWRVTGAAMLCLVVGPSAMLVASFGAFVGPLSAIYGWGPGTIGFAVSLMAAMIVLVSPVQGMLLDRMGARRLILCSIPPFALGFVGLAFMPRSLPLFYAGWAAMPLLAIGLWPVTYLKSVSGWFARRLGLATGVANAGIGFGTILIPLSVDWMIGAWGVRACFLGMAALALTAWPLAFLFIREASEAGPRRRGSWTYRAMVRQREWRVIAAGFFLLGISGTGLIANLVPILTASGLPRATAVLGISLFGAAALIGRLATGWLLDRFHAARVANIFSGAAGAAMLVLAARPPEAVALAAASLLGLISGAEFDVLAYTLRRYLGLDSFGKMYGAIFSLFQLGAGLGAAMLAASVAFTGAYSAALIALAASALFFMLLFARLGDYPASPVPPPA